MDPVIDDVYLLAALRLAAGTDPAPAAVGADAEAAWALRLPGATTAQPVPLPGGVGARSGDEPRLVRFTSDEVTIEVEFAFCDGRVDVAGQVRAAPEFDRRDDSGMASDGTGPGAARPAGEGDSSEGDVGSTVEIRTLRDSEVRIPSRTGHFAATGLPPGWLSVAWHRPGRPPVATRWLCVRE